jgi:hypothetical protein
VFERFTQPARRVLILAQEEARLLGHSFIGTEHLLLGLIASENEITSEVLIEMGVTLPKVRELVEETIPPPGGSSTGSPPFTPRAKKVMELSLREALHLGHQHIGTEHILLGLLREGEGVATQVLVRIGIDLTQVRHTVTEKLGVATSESIGDVEFNALPGDDEVNRGTLVACSFCGLTPPASGRLVSGNNAFICEKCIGRWSQRLGRRSRTVQVPPVTWRPPEPSQAVAPGEPPADPEAARTEIEIIFTDHSALSDDGREAIRVERGADLGWAVAAVRANRTSYLDADITFVVDEIVFTDPEHAAVWFSIEINGHWVLNRHRGDAVVIDGTWKMARRTFCDLVGMGGISVPPEHE